MRNWVKGTIRIVCCAHLLYSLTKIGLIFARVIALYTQALQMTSVHQDLIERERESKREKF